MKFAILGAGAMGRWFAKFAKDRDWSVSIADVDMERAERVSEELGLELSTGNRNAAEDADIVLVSVPIKETPKVIEDVADSLGKNSLLLDIASVKERAVATMKEIDADFELVSLHPLFGPGTRGLEDKDVISIPVKARKKYRKFKEILSDSGANVTEMEAGDHDRLMSVVQSLTHFTLLTYLSAFTSMENSEGAETFRTPMFEKLLELAKAFAHEDPKLSGDLQTENKYASLARGSILEACRTLNLAFGAGNVNIVEEIFDEAREKFGSEAIELAYESLYGEAEEE